MALLGPALLLSACPSVKSGSYRTDASFASLGRSRPLSLEGGLAGNEVVKSHINAEVTRFLQLCADLERERGATVKSRPFVVRFVIGANGSIDSVMSSGTSLPREEHCVTTMVGLMGKELEKRPEFHAAEPTRVTPLVR